MTWLGNGAFGSSELLNEVPDKACLYKILGQRGCKGYQN